MTDLTQAILEVRVNSPWDQCEFDLDTIGFKTSIRGAIATILNAAASGELIPLAEVQALIKAAEKRGWNEAIEAACKAAMEAPVFNPTAPQGELNVAVMVLARVGKVIRALKKGE